jgi:bleomycin hydrolase
MIMKMKFIVLILWLFPAGLLAQDTVRKDKGVFKDYKKGYYENTILKGIDEYQDTAKPVKRKYFSAEISDVSMPSSPDEFTKYWCNEPVSQGNTGTCWSFATTSFFESEIFRVTGKKIKLSEMYFVYWEYVERAEYFVEHKGDCTFSEGSESNALPRLMLKYGVVPRSVYDGMLDGQTVYDHSAMIEELSSCLDSVKKHCKWNDSCVTKKVRSILDKYMTEPPVAFEYEGVKYNPQSFLEDYCKILPHDYFSFMSDNRYTFNQKEELVEDDNWNHASTYYNVKADDFLSIVKYAVKNGYTISLCGDVSEPGIIKEKQVAVVPTFDIPSEYISDDSRQLRLSNGTTTDDHCIHLIGYLEKDGKFWFLTKDSGAGAFDGKYPGYKYLSEDYVKLKMMNLLLYKYGAKNVLDKIIK